MTPQAAMIFAAGFGTRMRPLTDARPKPLIEVAGRALLDHALELSGPLGIKQIINAHYLAEQIISHCATRPNCTVLHETPEVLDTGGGIKNALPALGPDPVFALNSDAVWAGPNPLSLLADAWEPDRMDALLMLVPITQTVGYTRAGNFSIDSSGRLAKDAAGQVYTGAQILRTDAIRNHDETVFSLHMAWNKALENGRAYGLTYPGRWADVGTPDGIALAEEMLRDADV